MCLSLADIEWGIHLICSPQAHWIACTNLNMPLYRLVFWVLTLCSLQVNNNMLEEPVVFIFKFEWIIPSFLLEWSKLRMWFGCTSSVARNVANWNHDREERVHFWHLHPNHISAILGSNPSTLKMEAAWCPTTLVPTEQNCMVSKYRIPQSGQYFANLKTCC